MYFDKQSSLLLKLVVSVWKPLGCEYLLLIAVYRSDPLLHELFMRRGASEMNGRLKLEVGLELLVPCSLS